MAVFCLAEKTLRAEQELRDFRTSGTAIDPDYYYKLILDITDSEKKARNAQAELMLMQMESIPINHPKSI